MTNLLDEINTWQWKEITPTNASELTSIQDHFLRKTLIEGLAIYKSFLSGVSSDI